MLRVFGESNAFAAESHLATNWQASEKAAYYQRFFPLIRAFTMKVRNHLLQPKCIAKRGAPRCACSVRIRHFAAIRAGPCVRVSGYFATEAP